MLTKPEKGISDVGAFGLTPNVQYIGRQSAKGSYDCRFNTKPAICDYLAHLTGTIRGSKKSKQSE